MSTRDKCKELLDSVPEFKLGYVLAYLQGLTADETADDAYCAQLYQDYIDDPDATKAEGISLEEFAAELGVSL